MTNDEIKSSMRKYGDAMPDAIRECYLSNPIVHRCFNVSASLGYTYTQALEYLALKLIEMNEAHRENLIRTAANAAL